MLTAEDAETGLVLARERRPDLIVMDVGLPGMDGNEATHRLKADPATRHILVVVLTAHVHHEDRERAEAEGCDHFLTKPLEPRALGAEVRRILAEGVHDTGRGVHKRGAPPPAAPAFPPVEPDA